MIEKVKEFDLFILNKVFQKSSDIIQTHFGINCFRLSNITFLMSFGFSVAKHFIIPHTLQEKSNGLGNILISCGIYCFVYICNQRDIASVKEGFMNHLQLQLQWVRIIWMVLLCIDICLSAVTHDVTTTLTTLNSLCWFASMYYMSCTPQPPAKSTVRKFIESFSNSKLEPVF